ncbi:helix-turn-helix domain-containing protein [Streptomyces sp. NPDC046203]|uniref:helix-turn-helix domain-containing protein n=1 Tax=Streptomyces sp. NPDC046203 TaxID=3154602 RepID=UPI0033C70FF6
MHHAGEYTNIVALLVQGWSDDRISRALALSERTVQRRVRMLMEEYGCTSRFALGFALGRRAVPGAQGRAGRTVDGAMGGSMGGADELRRTA